jgi:hypothetical protein
VPQVEQSGALAQSDPNQKSTPARFSAETRPRKVRVLLVMRTFSLRDPPELTRLVVGELPGPFEELCLGHWDAAIILRREVLCEKPRGVCRLVVRDGVVSVPRVSHRFLSFTPGASPLVNSTPAYSRVRRIASSVARSRPCPLGGIAKHADLPVGKPQTRTRA